VILLVQKWRNISRYFDFIRVEIKTFHQQATTYQRRDIFATTEDYYRSTEKKFVAYENRKIAWALTSYTLCRLYNVFREIGQCTMSLKYPCVTSFVLGHRQPVSILPAKHAINVACCNSSSNFVLDSFLNLWTHSISFDVISFILQWYSICKLQKRLIIVNTRFCDYHRR